MLLVSTDELAVPGKRLQQHQTAVAAAVKAGVKHILYTSHAEPDKSLISFAPDHLGTEEAIKASGPSLHHHSQFLVLRQLPRKHAA